MRAVWSRASPPPRRQGGDALPAPGHAPAPTAGEGRWPAWPGAVSNRGWRPWSGPRAAPRSNRHAAAPSSLSRRGARPGAVALLLGGCLHASGRGGAPAPAGNAPPPGAAPQIGRLAPGRVKSARAARACPPHRPNPARPSMRLRPRAAAARSPQAPCVCQPPSPLSLCPLSPPSLHAVMGKGKAGDAKPVILVSEKLVGPGAC